MSIDPELERRSKLMTHIRAGLLHSTKLLRRMLRNQSFKAHSRTHTDFYRAVMAEPTTALLMRAATAAG